MKKKGIESELKEIEMELKQSEVQEYLSSIESRHSFHLGLILGLVFAVAAGFFSIIFHEIFISGMTFGAKLFITILSGVVLLLCLYWGLSENSRNKRTRRRIWEHLKKE